MRFPRQEYWSGLPFPSLEDLPDPGIEPGSLTLQAESLPSKAPGNWDSKQKEGEKDSPIIPLDEKLILIMFQELGSGLVHRHGSFTCFLFVFVIWFFGDMLRGMWDLSSQTRN